MLPGEVDTIDAAGLAVVPGFIDGHQHFTGGGGEGGFHTRTPEMQLSMNTANGVTTAVGLWGTDALTRSVESLYAKTQSFNEDRSRIVSMGIGTPASLLFELASLVNTKGMNLEKALCPLTTTPARVYGLAGVKGELKVGADADILVLDAGKMAPN